jgi:hypothetical protein
MPDSPEDRAWVDAVDHYLKPARIARRRRSGSQGRYLLASAVLLALFISPVAIGATGGLLREGKRNPRHGAEKRETRFIGKTRTYVTRQSNIKRGDGGAERLACRSAIGSEPCLRTSNFNTGRAFEFRTNGTEGGHIQVKATGGAPLTTNATGVATGFNADHVDGFDAARIDFRAAAGTEPAEILNVAGLVLRASCGVGPDLDVRVDTTVVNSTVHVAWNKDPGNVPFYRQENDLRPGENFSLLGANDDSSQGTLVYTSPAGAIVSVTFQAEEGGAFASTTNCLFSGTALASAV